VSKQVEKGTYIGISKLSCYKCDQDLEQKYPHRGTHGVWFDDKTDGFASASQQLAENNDPRLFKHNHQRKLSTDNDYESETLA